MENIDIYKVLEVIFPILTAVFGVYWAMAKSKISTIATLLVDVDKALADGTLTTDEMKVIVADVMKVLGKTVETK
jgi:hypothetical protein